MSGKINARLQLSARATEGRAAQGSPFFTSTLTLSCGRKAPKIAKPPGAGSTLKSAFGESSTNAAALARSTGAVVSMTILPPSISEKALESRTSRTGEHLSFALCAFASPSGPAADAKPSAISSVASPSETPLNFSSSFLASPPPSVEKSTARPFSSLTRA